MLRKLEKQATEEKKPEQLSSEGRKKLIDAEAEMIKAVEKVREAYKEVYAVVRKSKLEADVSTGARSRTRLLFLLQRPLLVPAAPSLLPLRPMPAPPLPLRISPSAEISCSHPPHH